MYEPGLAAAIMGESIALKPSSEKRSSAESVKLIFSIWTLHLVLVPIYVFDSGSMQPSHMILLVALALALMNPDEAHSAKTSSTSPVLSLKINSVGRRICTLFALFALYVCIVNSAWMAVLASYKPLLFASFQIYNLALVYFIFLIASKDFYSFARHTRLGFSIANIIIIISIFYSGLDSASRESGLFNNPNQLAFFCLSSCLCFYVMEKLSIGTSLWNKGMIGLSCFICILTLSRAGLVACGLVFISSLLGGGKGSSRALMIAAIGVMLGFFAWSTGFLDKIEARNEQTNAVFEDQYQGRGYDRIEGNPEYLLLGAGEGEYRRFSGFLASIGGEMHSSVGTLIFSYGLIGFGLYAAIWGTMFFSYPGFAYKICAAAPIIYSVTHNGLRFSAAIIAIMLMIMGGIAASHQKTQH